MTTWTPAQLDAFDDVAEIDVVTTRADGTTRPPVPIWVVRVGDDVYVRSWRGGAGTWYRHAARGGQLQVRLCGQQLDVAVELVPTAAAAHGHIDRAYRTKYGQYGSRYVDPMVAPDAQAATLRLLPNDHTTNQ